MLAIVIPISLTMLGIAFALTFWRLVRGPGLPDRIVALDTLSVNAIALIMVYGIWLKTAVFFEIALLIALMGFVSTVALTKYLQRGDIIELK
jgi:multicomponent K+:H+ antiporter subunit F